MFSSLSFICHNWKIIQATSGRIDKELMKEEGESLKAIKGGGYDEDGIIDRHTGDRRRYSVCVCVWGGERERGRGCILGETLSILLFLICT